MNYCKTPPLNLKMKSALVLIIIIALRTVSAKLNNTDCDYFVQNCVPCMADGECYCRSVEEFTSMRCNKRSGERKGCFEIFDPFLRDFTCKLQTISVREITNAGIQFCRNFSRAEELLNIYAAHDACFEQVNALLMNLTNLLVVLSEQDRIVVTATRSLVIALMVIVIAFAITIVILMLCMWRKTGRNEVVTHYLEPKAVNRAMESKVDEDDGPYERMSNFQSDL